MKIKPTILAIMAMLLLLTVGVLPTASSADDKCTISAPQQLTYISEHPQPMVDKATAAVTELPRPPEPESLMAEEDVNLIALLAMAEAEGECEEGQRLVIDTVLNRKDDPRFPDSVYDVVYEPNQYSGMESPRIDCCYVKDELVELVWEELENRTNGEVIFFRTEQYSKYGTPLFQVGNHYFSSY